MPLFSKSLEESSISMANLKKFWTNGASHLASLNLTINVC
jgi:hypothetical protein